MIALSRARGMHVSLLVVLTTLLDRAAQVAAACSGFVYLLTRTGITGAGAGMLGFGGWAQSAGLGARVEALRWVTDLLIACGFGISIREQVADVLRVADAAIVGSAIVK